jgi:hypothetical protein
MSDWKSSAAEEGESLKDRLREEMRKYLIVSAYLYICFGAVQLYKAALLQDAGVHYLPLGVALVKALIIGKFLLLADAIRNKLQGRQGRLPGRIAKRVFWLLVILVLLTIAEELILGWIHGHSMVEMETEFRAGSMLELVAEVLLMGLILVPLVSAAELSQALGPGLLQGLLLQHAGSNRQAAGHDGAGDNRSP